MEFKFWYNVKINDPNQYAQYQVKENDNSGVIGKKRKLNSTTVIKLSISTEYDLH